MKTFRSSFISFWSQGSSRDQLAFFRIVYGCILILDLWMLYPDLISFFGSESFLNLKSFDLSDDQIFGIFYLWIISALALTVGFGFRWFMALHLAILFFFHRENVHILNNGDILMRVLGIYLFISPANRSFSVDNWIRYRKKKAWKPYWAGEMWPLRLMQIQISLMYLSTFWYKCLGEKWLDGTAVYYATRVESFVYLPIPFVLDQAWSLKLLTWGTLFIEVFLGICLWIPRLRIWAISLGIALHLSILLSMNILIFQLIAMSSYLLFLDPDSSIFSLARRFHRSQPQNH